MPTVQPQQVTQTGVAPVMSPATSAGDTWEPTSTTLLMIHNADIVAHTATVHVTAIMFGEPVTNVTVSLPAAGTVLAGPFDPAEVAQPGTNLGLVTYDNAAQLTLAAVEILPA